MKTFLRGRICIALFIAAAFFVDVCETTAQDAMKPTPNEQLGFKVIGIEARTNNTRESGADGVIPKQWQRLFVEGVLNRIPDRLDHSIVAVYTNYASDWKGDYTLILGAKVKPGANAPEGMVAKSVPAGKYIEFTSQRGPSEKVVPEMWKKVWIYFQTPGNLSREYGADYEVYDDLSDPSNVLVRLYVGVKP